MKTISIFVDESGDFGKYEKFSHYYVITMVIHNQDFNISEQISHLDRELSLMGYFQSFENVILYYDNGQQKLNHLLNLVLAACFSKYEVRKILPNRATIFSRKGL